MKIRGRIFLFWMILVWLELSNECFLYADPPTIELIQKEACSDIDLGDRLGPVRDQGNLGWCALHAASDLLTFEFSDDLKGQQASAIFVALISKNSINIPWENGALPSDTVMALEQSQKIGICPQLFEDQLVNQKESTSWIAERFRVWSNLKWSFDRDRKEFDKLFPSVQDLFLGHISRETVENIFRRYSQDQIWQALAIEMCGRSMVVPKKNKTIRTIKDINTASLKEINQQIGQSIPVFVAMPVRRFVEGALSLGNHAMVLVGRRWNEKKNVCEYKIRNSWGTGACDSYKSELRTDCKNGEFWYSAHALAKSLISAIYFESQNNQKINISLSAPAALLHVFPGEKGAILTFDEDGQLAWRQFLGADNQGNPQWAFEKKPQFFSIDDSIEKGFAGEYPGVFYFIDKKGNLFWYHFLRTLYQKTYLLETPKRKLLTAVEPARKLLDSWNSFKQVVSGSLGRIFVVDEKGTIFSFRHEGYKLGEDIWEQDGERTRITRLPFASLRLLGENDKILYGIDLKNKIWFYDMSQTSQKNWKRSNMIFPETHSIFWSREGIFYGIDQGDLWYYVYKKKELVRGYWNLLTAPIKIATNWYYLPINESIIK